MAARKGEEISSLEQLVIFKLARLDGMLPRALKELVEETAVLLTIMV